MSAAGRPRPRFQDTIRILLGCAAKGLGPLDPVEWQRVKARTAWVRETVAKLRKAQREMGERCDAAVHRLDEEAFERLCDAEAAKVTAIRAQLDAVIERDEWPRGLYWGKL